MQSGLTKDTWAATRMTITYGNKGPYVLTPLELAVFWMIAASDGPVGKPHIYKEIWGAVEMVWTSRALDVIILRLRKKVGALSILSKYGGGYKFNEEGLI